jgi:DNA-binding NtrC family response regulator
MRVAVMKKIIFCSFNPLLIKSLYGILRDEGYIVETVEHPARAIQRIMEKKYDFIIIDSDPFGLPAEDAVEIIKAIAPDLPVITIGDERGSGRHRAGTLVDLEELKKTIHSFAVMS